MPLDDVFELTGLFLLDVRRQEDSRSSQAVVLEVQKHSFKNQKQYFVPKNICKSRSLLIHRYVRFALDKTA